MRRLDWRINQSAESSRPFYSLSGTGFSVVWFVRDGYFHISNLEWGSGTEKMRCIFSFPSSSVMREKREWKNKKFLYPKTMNGMALCVIRNFAEFFFSFLLIYCIFFSPILNSSLRNAHLPANQQESPDDWLIGPSFSSCSLYELDSSLVSWFRADCFN